MEKEMFFSGYCRAMDQSRTVTVVTVDTQIEEMDCAYDRCIHQKGCPLAKKIGHFLEEVGKKP